MMRGGDLQALREVLGHARLAMTMRYAHLAPEHLRTEMLKTERADFSTKSAHGDRLEATPLVSPRNAGVAQWQSN